MNQHLLRELQELKQELAELNRKYDRMYEIVVEHSRMLNPSSTSPETQPIDPDETRWE